MPASVAARLQARYGAVIAGVKDSSADFAQFRAFRAAAPDIAVTVGNEPDIGRALAEGGAGTICGMGNVAPALVRAMFRPDPPASQMQAACGLISGPFIALLKAMLAARTGQAGWLRVRAPWRPATMEDGVRLLAQLENIPLPLREAGGVETRSFVSTPPGPPPSRGGGISSLLPVPLLDPKSMLVQLSRAA